MLQVLYWDQYCHTLTLTVMVWRWQSTIPSCLHSPARPGCNWTLILLRWADFPSRLSVLPVVLRLCRLNSTKINAQNQRARSDILPHSSHLTPVSVTEPSLARRTMLSCFPQLRGRRQSDSQTGAGRRSWRHSWRIIIYPGGLQWWWGPTHHLSTAQLIAQLISLWLITHHQAV